MMNENKLINLYEKIMNIPKKHTAIQLYNNKMMYIEVCLDILEFDENSIRLEIAESYVTITGFDLQFRNYNKNGIQIKGNIHSITFEDK